MLNVAFLGIGRMGTPMAANVARAGFPLTLYNRTAAKAEKLAAEVDARVAASPAEAAEGADVLVTMVADGPAVMDLYHGPEGALQNAKSGAIALNMSTIGPDAVQPLADLLAPRGVRLVDAPVSGSTATAEAGKLTIMVGGADDDVATVLPVLEAIGRPVIRVGALGTGQAMKLAVNSLIFALGQGVAESLVLAERAGIERTSAYEVFVNSAAAAPMLSYRRDAYERPGEVPATFRLVLAVKDLELITELARRVGAPMPQATLDLEQARAAADAGYGEDDMAAVAEYLRRLAERL